VTTAKQGFKFTRLQRKARQGDPAAGTLDLDAVHQGERGEKNGENATAQCQPADVARREQGNADENQTGQGEEKHLLEDEDVARLVNALGDRGACRENEHVADTDEGDDAEQRPAIDGPPPAAENGLVGAGKCRHYAPASKARA
jgi:hypothetical protein